MNSRERVICSISHQEPDRIPWDFWVTSEVVERLQQHLGLSNEEAILKYFDVDLRYYRGPSFIRESIPNKDDNVIKDLWGVPRKKVTVKESNYQWTYGHVTHSPLEQAETVDEIDNYQHWPSPDWWDYTDIERDCSQDPGYALVYAGDRLDRTAQLKPAMYIRGMEQIYLDLYQNPRIVEALLSHIKRYFMEYNERVFKSANGKLDIFMMGDDFGTQRGLMMNADLWRKYFKEGFRDYISLAHKYNMKVMHHTCGSIRELIPDFIDCGLDILQSLQPRAAGMDLRELKREFGKELTFHGSIDIQTTLPSGTVEDVKTEVRQRMEAGKPGGGFIISTAHNIQPDTPLENILAMFNAYREFGGYQHGGTL